MNFKMDHTFYSSTKAFVSFESNYFSNWDTIYFHVKVVLRAILGMRSRLRLNNGYTVEGRGAHL